MEIVTPLLSWGIPALVLVFIGVSLYRLRRPRFTGPALTGVARILSVQSTGTVINDRYVCKINLSVELPGREPYEVTVRQAVHPIQMPSVQPGLVVSVEVDSTKPDKVRIDPGARVHGAAQPPSTAALAAAYNEHKQRHGAASGQWASAAQLLASGRRVPGVLRSFASTGNTLRSLGREATAMPELLDAPQYVIEMELRFPNLAPIVGRSVQSIPDDHVPSLAVGLELPCAVDPSDPARRFVVDWQHAIH
ncbi:hypothetical protein [Mycobacterium sp. TY814]|uniref:hypothetical protein n=1 Tax=unclassified Mycobacterium TaxID=2642494 RepID=UPI002740B79E|nr:hypothetical protein [Mycobacterium sp. TY814]MDP7723796.1 hypothetical protein [Mycobacterium sp. TY814]